MKAKSIENANFVVFDNQTAFVLSINSRQGAAN